MYVMASVATVSQAHSITGNIGHPLLVCVCVCMPFGRNVRWRKKKKICFQLNSLPARYEKYVLMSYNWCVPDKRGEKIFHAGRSQLVHVSQSKSLMMNQVMKLQQAGYLTLTSWLNRNLQIWEEGLCRHHGNLTSALWLRLLSKMI